MKKILFLMACASVGFSISAQEAVVKEAEKAMKSGKPYTEVMTIIAPAQTNPETQNNVNVYYIPGKAGFKQYDDLLGRNQLGMLKDGEDVIMANALIGGYDNYIKALPLDTVVDAKGKIKTKHSKDIKSTIAGHYNDFSMIGGTLWGAKDFKNAYKAWDIFAKLSENADAFGIKAAHDTIVGNMMFNRGLAAWQIDDLAAATRSFREAVAKGYNDPQIYQYGIATATGANLNDDLLFFASEGNRLYGKDDSQYINNLINYYLKVEKYDEAIAYLDAAISENPDNAQYFALEGIIYDNKGDREKSIDLYKKAVSLDNTNGLANYYLGRALLLKAGDLSDNYAGDATKFNEYKTSELDPIFKDAIEYLETAYKSDVNNRSEILKALEVGYYNLNDQAGLDSVKERKLED